MTYSLASVANLASDVFPASGAQVQLADANALPGAQQNAMRNGTQVLCKMPDGALKYCTIDPPRWTPGSTPYVLPVGP